MAAELAGYGYAVLLPDIYYRQPGWAPFDMATVFGDDAERQRLFAMMAAVTPQRMTDDAQVFFDYLASRSEVRGTKFGVCGYCMGGRTSIIVAGRLPDRVGAAASFHGGGLVTNAADSPHLSADRIMATVYVAGAVDDASFTEADAETLDAALTGAEVSHQVEFYPAAHGFAVADSPSYDPDAAARHWAAMRSLFADALG